MPQPFVWAASCLQVQCPTTHASLLLRAGGGSCGSEGASAQGLLDDVPAVSIDPGKWKYVAITLTAPGETPKVRDGDAEHRNPGTCLVVCLGTRLGHNQWAGLRELYTKKAYYLESLPPPVLLGKWRLKP